MDDPDLDREIARIRRRLTSLEAEKAELVSRLAGLERGRQEATSLSPPRADAAATSVAITATSPPAQKIELFRRRFAGRPGVFPVRWENVRTQRFGYAPACANEWVKGICGKPQVKCGECPNQAFIAVSDAVVARHLTAGKGPAPGNRRRLRDGGLCVAAR